MENSGEISMTFSMILLAMLVGITAPLSPVVMLTAARVSTSGTMPRI